MCSCRTCVRMVACISIPAFELRAAMPSRPRLALRPAALAPVDGTEPLLGPVTSAAEANGIRPGMRLGEALALCPSLVLVEADPQRAEREWEEILRRLEDAGIAVSPAEPGTAFFETRGVERLYGGIEPTLKRALAAVGPTWDARIGAAERKFAALAAAHVAGPGQLLVVSAERTREFLAPSPNVWGRTAGVPGASREAVSGVAYGGAAHRPSSWSGWSSRTLSATSSR